MDSNRQPLPPDSREVDRLPQMTTQEAVNYLYGRFGVVEFHSVQGVNRVTVRLSGSFPVERYTLEEAVEAAKLFDDKEAANA